MPVITATVIALLALGAGLTRAARVHGKHTAARTAVEGGTTALATAAVALACLYTAAAVAGVLALVFLLLAARAFDRGRVFTAVAWTLCLFVCLSLTGLVGR